MYSLKNDYSEGAHPRLLNALVATNAEQTAGYGEDPYTIEACELLKQQIGQPEAAVHLLVGGTQTNLTAISAFLRPHQAAVAVESGHIATHETGAIEATGHKVVVTPGVHGKLTVEAVDQVVKEHTDEHMVKPKLVYISNSTEIGTIYTKAEIIALYTYCQANNLILFVDGARLGAALCAQDNDVTLEDLGKYTDAFYIGGTKNGALMGEALVINNPALQEEFRYLIKQKGALLAKGRLLGIQYLELFKDGLFYELATHANEQAMLLQEAIKGLGYTMLADSTTNQIFPIFPYHIIEKLQQDYAFYIWEAIDAESAAVRLVTSWATDEAAVQAFIKRLTELTQ